MPEFDSTVQEKLDAILAAQIAGENVSVCEVVGIEWPDGTIYYSSGNTASFVSQYGAPFIDGELEPRLQNPFNELSLSGDIGDAEVELDVWDGDEAFSLLLTEHGEGVKGIVYWWFPRYELFLERWHGHLQYEDAATLTSVTARLVQGFRSSEGELPSRGHYRWCNAVFGGDLPTQTLIDQHGCPYNVHIGGAVGIPGFTTCDRRDHNSCITRGVPINFHQSHRTVQATVANNQTSGNRLYSTSRGNETNLNDNVRVVMGTRRIYGMPLLAYRRDLNNNNPGHGWFAGIYEACEGPIQSLSQMRTSLRNGNITPSQHFRFRLGQYGQTPVWPEMTPHSYSGTAHALSHDGWLNPADVDAGSCTASSYIVGLNNLRIYSNPTTHYPGYTTNRVWQIMEMYTNKRWGYKHDHARLDIASWISAATWANQGVRFSAMGVNYDHTRAASNPELIGRKIQTQFEDMCMAGRLTKPFLFNGKLHIEPLRKLTEDELAEAPVFTDDGDARRNIVYNGAQSSLSWERKSAFALSNRIEAKFDDATNDWIATDLRPVEDVQAQLDAGKLFGDGSRKVNKKSINLLGVTDERQAYKVMFSVLDLGEFDTGGLQNNLRVTFQCFFADGIRLHPGKVIRVLSQRLEKYGFEYFRIIPDGLTQNDDLTFEVQAQAYNVAYMETFETLLTDIGGGTPTPPPPGPIPPPGGQVCPLGFKSVTYGDGIMRIEIDECQQPPTF